MLVSRNNLIKVFGLSAGRAMYLRAHKLNLEKHIIASYIPVIRHGQPTEQYCQMVHYSVDDLIDSYIYNVDPRYARQCRDREMKLKRRSEEHTSELQSR